MSLNISWLLSPRTFFAAIFGTNPNTPLRLGQPWNKNILNTIWIIQFIYSLIMIGSGIAGLITLKTSPISDALKEEFKTMFYIVLPFTLFSLIIRAFQEMSSRLFKNNYAMVRRGMIDGSQIQIWLWSLISPVLWWFSKWKKYDRLILNWALYMYDFTFFLFVVPSIFMLIGYWKDLEAGRPSQEQEEGEALIDQSTYTSQ